MGEFIDDLRKQEANIQAKMALCEEFPDLHITRDRWRKERLSAKSANALCDDVWFNHNCGCCADSPLQAWPHVKRGELRIHSDPACFMIGERNAWGYGEKPWDNWEKKLREAGINEGVISKIEAFLAEHPPKEWEDDDDEE